MFIDFHRFFNDFHGFFIAFGEGAVRLGDWLGVGKSWFSLGFSKFLGRGGDAGAKEHRINPFRAQPWQARLENTL